MNQHITEVSAPEPSDGDIDNWPTGHVRLQRAVPQPTLRPVVSGMPFRLSFAGEQRPANEPCSATPYLKSFQALESLRVYGVSTRRDLRPGDRPGLPIDRGKERKSRNHSILRE